MGERPRVLFIWSLCTVVAIVSQSAQSSCCVLVTRQRYCSTHWFLHSERPSICGWKAMERFCSTPSHERRACLKCEVKQGSLSKMTFMGRLNHLYTLSRYSRVMPGPVIIVAQG